MTDSTTRGKMIGQRVARREDSRLLTGRGQYVDDVTPPGLLHVAFVRSPTARALVTGVDIGAARELPGVQAVLTLDDLDAVRDPEALFDLGLGPPMRIAPPLASDSVQFVGDPVALVVATDRATAEDGSALVEVDYEPLAPAVGLDTTVRDHDTYIGPDVESRLLPPVVVPSDTTEQIIAGSRHVVTEKIVQNRYLPVPMETRGIVAAWDAAIGQMTVWSSTQGPHRVREHLASVLGVAEHRVRVIVADVGGAFGLKLFLSREETAVALAARILSQPVKWIEDRWENLIAGGQARAEEATISIALDDDGTVLALHTEHLVDVGAYGSPNLGLARMISGPYRVTAVSGTTTSVRTNLQPRVSYRGPWMFETMAREMMVDIAARRLGLDPLEVRRRNVLHSADLPFTTIRGTYEDVTPAETLERAAASLGYDAFRAEQREARESGRFLGVGISLLMEPTASAIGTGSTEAVTLRIDVSGGVQLITGANSQGHSIETTMAQVVADELGVPFEEISFANGDTAAVPVGAATGGSRNAVYGGGAAMQAAGEMRNHVIAIAAHMLEAAPEDMTIESGIIHVRGAPSRSLTVADVARVAYREPSELPPGTSPGLEVNARFATGGGATWSNSCHLCTCEVDVETGEIRLLRYIVSSDCGTVINPAVVEGQLAGGIVQGIGGVLLENFVYDEDGNPLTSTFADYLLPTTTDVPTIEYDHLETPSKRLGGFKGMAEGGAIGAPAAVVNAVADALAPLGVTITRTPLTPDTVLAAITAARG